MELREWKRAMGAVVKAHEAFVLTGCLTENRQTFLNALNEFVEFCAMDDSADFRPYSDHAELASRLRGVDAEHWPSMSDPIWRCVDAIVDTWIHHEHPEPQRPESVETLTKQNVNNAQICAIWGLKKPDGSPDMYRLNQEREKPGSVVTPDYWPPVQAGLARRRAEAMKSAHATQRRRIECQKEAPIARESIEELAASGVSARQIAAMKQMRVADVVRYCETHGVTVRMDYSGATQVVQPIAANTLNPGPAPTELDVTLDEPSESIDQVSEEEEQEQQVLALKASGLSLAKISAAVGLSVKQVRGIVDRAKAAEAESADDMGEVFEEADA